LGALAALVAAFYAEEGWRGHRDWNQYRQALEARGVHLDFLAYIPKPVPEEQNFAATPIVKSMLQADNPIFANDFYARAENHVYETNIATHKGPRHFLDLEAWRMAWVALQAGALKPDRSFESDKTDLAAREAAAGAVLEGMKSDETVFAALRLASGRPYCRYPIQYDVEDPGQIPFIHLLTIKRICQRLNLRACAELAAGQTDEALADVKLMWYLTDTIKPFVISYLVRGACFQMAVQPVWEGLAEHRWSALQLQDLQARFQAYDFLADLVEPLNEERTFGIREIDHYKKTGLGYLYEFYDIETGDIDDIGKPTWHKRVVNLLGRILPDGWYAQERLKYCTLFDAQMEGVMDPAGKRVFPARAASNEAELNRQLPNPSMPLSLYSILRHQGLASGLRFLNKIHMKAAAAQTAANQAAIACALERHRLANGQFPETLEALAPQFMPRLPNDVITGQPYKYRRTEDGQFILYSVGWNERDDGGVPGKTLFDETQGDWVWDYPGK
jgi:hypothetical protein